MSRCGPNLAPEGARARSTLHAALDTPAGWITAAGTASCDDDAQLYRVAREVLAGEVGDFARSHGGSIELLDVRDGIVTVRLGGTCHGCPASWFTLHQRLERAATASRSARGPQRRLTGQPVRSSARRSRGDRLTAPV
ncbi:Fe-S cluster biogenesis protein NfuA [Streptomyces achromogenes]|uniref:NifU family protein n=1 Tax=Streptomyces achromogenes TaxID=67255 RepID=UPI002780089E|nr:NifU family protein [Streptomyces achromogenes]MDQ0834309.1 Fe-S cluster biogenesis protein NfuA [Streptomyces achromogenes]